MKESTMYSDEALERALREAMAAQVADVRAPAFGPAVRRRRVRAVWFRTAGAALVTAAVAGAFPAYQALIQPGPAGSVLGARPGGPPAEASGPGEPVPAEVVPSPEAPPTPVAESASGAPPTPAGEFSVAGPPEPIEGRPTPERGVRPEKAPADAGSDSAGSARDVRRAPPGDLDAGGRVFGPVELRFLPSGLKWSGWWGQDGFGKGSLTTFWNREGDEAGRYRIQIILYQGGSLGNVTAIIDRHRTRGAEPIRVGDRIAYLVRAGEAAGAVDAEHGTPTITWLASKRLGVQLMMSPDHAAELGSRADRTLTQIARRLHVIEK